MAEVKNSQMLQILLDQAKTYGDPAHSSLTAERVLLAALDVLAGKVGGDRNALAGFSDYLSEKHISPEKLSAALRAVIDAGKQGLLDSMYLSKKLIEARNQASREGRAELDAQTLIDLILTTPSDSVGNALKESVTEQGSGSGKSASDQLADILSQASGLMAALSGGAKPAETPAQPAQPEQPAPAPAPASASSGDGAHDGDGKLTASGISGLLAQSSSVMGALGGGGSKKPEPGVPTGPKPETAAPEEKESLGDLTVRTKKLRNALLQSVFGQDHAVNLFATGYFQGEVTAAMDEGRIRPRATFLFAGPPGVGKTLLAEKAAEALGLPFMRFDMSEYADKEANLEFAGTDKVYKGSKEGNVTGFVAKHPQCVLLFDEIEKANLVVIHLFLQLLDAGRLRDNYTDEEVSFKDAIIFFTTNAGRGIYEEDETANYAALSRKVILRSLATDVNPVTGGSFFPSAILSRFSSGNVVMFNHISAYNLLRVAKKELTKQAENFEKANNIAVEFDDAVYSALLFGEGGAADARAVRGRSESFFLTELFELTRLISSDKVPTNVDQLKKVRVTVEVPKDRPEIRELFERGEEKTKVLLFADAQAADLCRRNSPDTEFLCAETFEAAQTIVKEKPVDLIVIDIATGLRGGQTRHLNAEDIDSEARDFYRYVLEEVSSTPLYMLETRDGQYSEEERTSFLKQGVRAVLSLSSSFGGTLSRITDELHQQAGMLRLAGANKVLRFETAQTVSEDGEEAQIKLFDFSMRTAVDSEDQGSLITSASRPDVRFDEVIGAEDAKRELEYFVQYLKNPRKYLGTGVAAPRGLLLYGPPGTGKTMLAKAMAAESGVTFLAMEGNQFMSKWVGEGAERVHEAFRKARKYAPAILFVDEIDTIARKRTGSDRTNSEEGTLTAFLSEMDGFKKDPSKPVFVLAATNYDADENSERALDGAILRRFDRCIYIDLPKKEDRVKYIRMKLSKSKAYQISEEQIRNLTVRSTGMSLAQLESVFEVALRSAIRKGSTVVTDEILEDAFETFNSGDEKKWSEKLLERTARHEAGHTFLYWEYGDTPSYVTVVARGNHGGYMQHDDKEDTPLYTREDLLARIRTALGGRACELVYYGEEGGISTGPSADLQQATRTAKMMLGYYGMSDEFGLGVYDREEMQSGELAAKMNNAVNRILSEQLLQAQAILQANRAAVDALVKALLEQDHLNGDEINAILSAHAKRRVKDV